MSTLDATQQSVDDQAAEWLALLRSDRCTEEDRGAFAVWLAMDKSHSQAMDRTLDLWDDLQALQYMPDAAFEPAVNHHRRQWLAGGLALAATVALAAVLLPRFDQSEASLQFQTAMGEQSTVELADGSTVLLNTDTRISVSYTEERRDIDLLQGEAYFSVVSDSQRPFVVNSGAADVAAVGTAFNIYRAQDDARITVSEGVVRVTERNAPSTRAAATELLHANQAMTASPAGLADVTIVNTGDVLAWQQGKIIAHEMPLPELAAQIERYFDTDIVITDPAVAAHTVSGDFDLDAPDSLLTAVAVSLNLQLDWIDSKTVRLLNQGE